MKRSAAVPLTLVTAATAGALAACGSRAEPLACVESTSGRVVPDSLCAAARAARPTTATGPAVHAGSGGFSPGIFGWYYGGRVVNGLMRGGSYAPSVGRSYRSPSGSFLGGGATRANEAVRPSLGRPAPGSARPGFGRPAVRGGFGGIGAGRAGGA